MTTNTAANIQKIRLARFKCFSNESFNLRPLTILTGLNGTGKSTVIQGLLLAVSAFNSRDASIALNKSGIALGQADDIFTFGEENSTIEIGLTNQENIEVIFHISRIDGDSLRMRVGQITTPAKLNLSDVAYLCAERLGPRSSLPLASQGEGMLTVGPQGEHTAQFLDACRTQQVAESRRHFSTKGDDDDDEQLITVPKQTERWMREFVHGLEVKTIPVDAALQTALRFKTGGPQSDFIRPINMGFGVSYSLPIIVQGLAMPKGGIFIVENPEAHLHPAGQSAMGKFLGLLAADGVQVIVETHSDHVLNGICLAAVEDKHPLKRSDVLIHTFLTQPYESKRVVEIEIDKQGGFSQNPPSFFDQSGKDLQAILHARKPQSQIANKLRARNEEKALKAAPRKGE